MSIIRRDPFRESISLRDAIDRLFEESFILREHRYGRFERVVTLPCAVRADKVEAVFENGVLTLTMPMAEETRSKKVQIKVKK